MNTTHHPESIFFWLCPTSPLQERLQSIIDAASQQYSTLSFLPHVTVGSAVLSPVRAQEIVDELAGGAGITGRMADSFCGDGTIISLTMGYAVALEAQASSIYTSLSQQMQQAGVKRVIPEPELHLSLIYRNGGLAESECSVIKAFAKSQSVEGSTLALTEIVAVALPDPFVDQQQVEQWRVVARAYLQGAAPGAIGL